MDMKSKNSQIVNFRKSNLKTCSIKKLLRISSANDQLSLSQLKINKVYNNLTNTEENMILICRLLQILLVLVD